MQKYGHIQHPRPPPPPVALSQVAEGASTTAKMKALREYAAGNEHKTFRVSAKFLLEDSLTYLSLYLSVRIGDVDLRLAGLREIDPLFLVYGKNLYHDLAKRRLRAFASMTATKRQFSGEIFSILLKGNVGKNHALDEIQETTLNIELKMAANRSDPAYLRDLAWGLQSKQVRYIYEVGLSNVIPGN